MDSGEPLPLGRLFFEPADVPARRATPLQLPADLVDLGDSNRCVNCGDTVDWVPLPKSGHRRWLFCTELCQQEAKYVRYFRSTARDGRQTDPGVLQALDMRLAHILGGGYPAEERRLSRSMRDLVLKRDSGRCVNCGRAGDEIDHIEPFEGPALNSPGNLQLLCKACHLDKTRRNLVPLDPANIAAHATADRLENRCHALEPLSPSDDERQWEAWRPRLASNRRARHLGHLEQRPHP